MGEIPFGAGWSGRESDFGLESTGAPTSFRRGPAIQRKFLASSSKLETHVRLGKRAGKGVGLAARAALASTVRVLACMVVAGAFVCSWAQQNPVASAPVGVPQAEPMQDSVSAEPL